jgi:hypothetical protein
MSITFKTYKSEIVRVNLSETFMVRSRCKSCGELPSMYYYFKNPVLFDDVNEVRHIFGFIKKYISRMCDDFYLIENPSSFKHMSYFGFRLNFKGYNPKLHKTRTPWVQYKQELEITEFLTCECGKTSWAFSDKTIKLRPEIIFKKARYKYPKKFDF